MSYFPFFLSGKFSPGLFPSESDDVEKFNSRLFPHHTPRLPCGFAYFVDKSEPNISAIILCFSFISSVSRFSLSAFRISNSE